MVALVCASWLVGLSAQASPFPAPSPANTPSATASIFGDGRNGSPTATTGAQFNPVFGSASGAHGATVLSISNVEGGGFTALPTELSLGMLVMIHQSRGAYAGVWEFNTATAATSSQLTLAKPLANDYVTDSGANRAQVLWVPQYTDVTVPSGVTISPAHGWNGNTGGIIAFLANGTVNISGSLQANGSDATSSTGTNSTLDGGGFKGGTHVNGQPGYSGEGDAGSAIQTTSANGSGGGGGFGHVPNVLFHGSGGGNGTPGGAPRNAGSLGVPEVGRASGNDDLTIMNMGGGGGAAGYDGGGSSAGGSGGNGGGIIFVAAADLTVSGAATAKGGKGGDTGNSSEAGGGGAGGSILFRAKTLGLGSNQAQALGGAGGYQNGGSGSDGPGGGNGGDGRIRIEYCDSLSGTTSPAASALQFCYPPANDNFADAQLLALPTSVAGTKVGATQETGEPVFCGAAPTGASVWYRFIPAFSGTLAASVDNSSGSGSPTLGLHTGASVSALTDLGCAQPSEFTAILAATSVTAGQAYYLRVAGVSSSGGAFTLTAGLTSPPANDSFANAQSLTLPATVSGTTIGATRDLGDPSAPCGYGRTTSVWYRVIPSASGALQATANLTVPMVLSLWSGSSLATLTAAACLDNPVAGATGTLAASVVGGQTYYLRVGGSTPGGSFTLDVSLTLPPANDNFADAQPLTLPATVAGNNTAATIQADEYVPGCAQSNTRSVWYRFTPATSVPLTMLSSLSDSVLTLYTGSALASLAELDCGYRAGSPVSLTANVTAGQVYYLRLASAADIRGAFTLSLSVTTVTWTSKASMSNRRSNLGAAAASSGKLYAVGGCRAAACAARDVEEYDPSTNTWTTKADMPTARWGLGVAPANNGKLYAIGGHGGTIDRDTVEEYNPSTNTWATKASMPTARSMLGAALATNGRIYAIGGTNGSTQLATVEEFNPATNTWAAQISMPTARDGLAVAAGSNGKVYAVGGYNFAGGGYLATMEEYDSGTGAWLTRAPMPTARRNLGLVMGANGKLYAIGGRNAGGNLTSTVEEYDPATNTWTTRTSIGTARELLGAAASAGKLYVVGGYNGAAGPYDGSDLATVEEATFADLAAPTPTPTPSATPTPAITASPTLTPIPTVTPTPTRTPTVVPTPAARIAWTTRAAMPTARYWLGLAAPNSGGRLYAIGGYSSSRGLTLASLEEYDPTTNVWAVRPSMPTARWGVGVAAAQNGKIYAVGGNGGTGPLNKTEEYDPATGAWRTRANMPTERFGLALAGASNGKLYAIGGLDLAQQPVAFVEEYDPATDTWASKARVPTARGYLAVVGATNGKLYAIGGYNPALDYDLAAVEEYDPTTDTWTTKGSMPTARQRLGSAQASNGKIYAVGGYQGVLGSYLGVVEEYDPATDAWTAQTSLPTPRGQLAVALGPDGRIYAVGGYSAAAGGSAQGVRGTAAGEVNTVEAGSILLPGEVPPTATATPAGNGLLRVYSDPAVATTIFINGSRRNDWGLDWLELPAGDYTLSFGEVTGFTAPATVSVQRCNPSCGAATDQSVSVAVTVRVGETTVVRAPFTALGFVRATTAGYGGMSPTILLDGQPANEWGIWVAEPAGTYMVSFEDLSGLSHPCDRSVAVTAGATTRVDGNYGTGACTVVAAGGQGPGIRAVGPLGAGLRPAVPRGEQTRAGLLAATPQPPTPGPQTPTLRAQPSSTPSPTLRARGLAASGLLRVYSDPSVATTMKIDGTSRNDWGLDWLELPAGDYTLSFRGVTGFASPTTLSVRRCNPNCGSATDQAVGSAVTVRPGETTEVRAAFGALGFLRVTTEGYGSASPTIAIDGNPANEWGAWVAVPAGTYSVSFESLAGLTPPCIRSAPVTAGATTHVHGNYTAGTCAIVP